MTDKKSDDLMTVGQAAEELRVDIPAIYKYVEENELKAIVKPHVANGTRIRRFSLEQLKKKLNSQ